MPTHMPTHMSVHMAVPIYRACRYTYRGLSVTALSKACGTGFEVCIAGKASLLVRAHRLGMAHRSTHVHIPIYTHIHIYTYTHIHIYIYVSVHMPIHMAVPMSRCISMHMSIIGGKSSLMVRLA